MPDTTLEHLKKVLDSEIQADVLFQLSDDFYAKISAYSLKLKRSVNSGTSEVTNRLVAKQARMIDSMARELLSVRARKAVAQKSFSQLLPEERYVYSAERKFRKRFETFVEAVSGGQPSFIEYARKTETERSVSVRFTKNVGELVGLDSHRYGPFEAGDVASLPAVNADTLISSGDAVRIYTREES